jgi:hypothetical protein
LDIWGEEGQVLSNKDGYIFRYYLHKDWSLELSKEILLVVQVFSVASWIWKKWKNASKEHGCKKGHNSRTEKTIVSKSNLNKTKITKFKPWVAFRRETFLNLKMQPHFIKRRLTLWTH